MARYLTFDQAMQLFGLTGNKFQNLIGSYIDKGSIAFENLPTPNADRIGYGYNVTDDFVTDSRFVDGPNRSYSAGTNVMIVPIPGDPVTYGYDVISNYVDESSLIAPIFDNTTAYSKDDVCIYDGKLYVAKDDTPAGEFDPANFDLVSVTDLIKKNESRVDGEKLIIGG